MTSDSSIITGSHEFKLYHQSCIFQFSGLSCDIFQPNSCKMIPCFFGFGGVMSILFIIFLIAIFPLVALIDVLTGRFDGNDKIVWVLLIIFLPFLGALLYFLIGRDKRS